MRYTATVAVSIFFGIDHDCFKNPNSKFMMYGKLAFAPNLRNVFCQSIAFLCPPLAKLLHVRYHNKAICDFFIKTVRETVEYRTKNNILRKDVFQLLSKLRNTGSVENDDWSAAAASNVPKFMSIEDMAAHAFSFLPLHLKQSLQHCLFVSMNWQKIRTNNRKHTLQSGEFLKSIMDV